MATELAKAYVQIIPSANGIKDRITEQLGGEAEKAGDSAGNLAGSKLVSGIKKVIAVAGIGAALKSAITEGAALEQSIGGIETLFKDSADIVEENAKKAYRTAGLSANAYMENVTSFSASLLSSLGGNTQKAADVADMAMVDMSDNANKMGTDMQDIQNAYQGFAKQNYTMLDNLKLGYGGTKTEMQRLLADAQKISGVEYNINNLSDVYEAIHVIQDELDITGTTAKEAATTLSGSLASMKAAATNVLGNLALGEDIVPALVELRETVHTFIDDNLIPMLGNIINALPGALQGVSTLIVTELNAASKHSDEIVNTGIEVVENLIIGILTEIPYLAEAAIRLVASFASTLIDTDWSEVCRQFITGLTENLDVAAGEILGTDGNIVESVITAVNNGLPDVLNKGVDLVGNLADGILSNLPYAVECIGCILQSLVEFILDNLPLIWQSGVQIIEKLAQGLIDNLPEIASSAGEIIIQLLASIAERLPELLEMGFTLIGELTAGLIKAVPDLLAEIPGIIGDIWDSFTDFDWADIGINIISGIKNGIVGAAGTIADAAKDAAQGALNGVKGLLGIHSPSRVFENEVGKMIDLGLAEGIENNAGQVTDAMKELSDSTVGTIQTDLMVNPVTGTAETVQPSTTQINFNGSYSFRDEKDIDYFMNQAALRLAVSR